MTPTTSGRRRFLALALSAGAALALATASGTVAQAAVPATGEIRAAGSPNAIPGSYIVVLKDKPTAAAATAQSLATAHRGTVGFIYDSALNGFEARMSEREARRLAADPAVAYVEQNQTVSLSATQTNPPSWGLDRSDQRNLPLNASYTFPNTASNVRAYIIDTGIRFTHNTFGGRATSGFDAVDGGAADDGNGHGTHVAGTVGGNEFGIAKGVQLVAVRVLNNAGSGTLAGVIAGVNWVTSNAVRPAVANMSLGGGISTAMDSAVATSINSGVTYAIAAGNGSGANACNTSPARTPAAITVGATAINDARAGFSNIGTCLDIFAPGQGITSAWRTNNTATSTISGTSMATPHVAGAAALILSTNPSFSPAQVRSALVGNATPNVVTNAGTGSPNLLLFVAN